VRLERALPVVGGRDSVVLILTQPPEARGWGFGSTPWLFLMTTESGRIVNLSFRDWLGLIGLVTSMLVIVVGCWIHLIRMMERIDASVQFHNQRLQRIESQLDTRKP